MKERIVTEKSKRYCMTCLKCGHNSRTCQAEPVSKEEKALFRSRRIRKYKLKCKGWTKRRQKTQRDYYLHNKDILKEKRRRRY